MPRIFGQRGFLWGLCETDISQSEIILSCLSNEYENIKKIKDTYDVDVVVEADNTIKEGKSELVIVQTYDEYMGH